MQSLPIVAMFNFYKNEVAVKRTVNDIVENSFNHDIFLRTIRATNGFETPSSFGFFQQPISQSVKHGTPVTFTCKAKYEQYSVRYRWYRFSEVQIPPEESSQLNQTSSVITVDIYKTDSKLLFQCRAESESQVIYSDVAKVTIACKQKSLLKSSLR